MKEEPGDTGQDTHMGHKVLAIPPAICTPCFFFSPSPPLGPKQQSPKAGPPRAKMAVKEEPEPSASGVAPDAVVVEKADFIDDVATWLQARRQSPEQAMRILVPPPPTAPPPADAFAPLRSWAGGSSGGVGFPPGVGKARIWLTGSGGGPGGRRPVPGGPGEVLPPPARNWRPLTAAVTPRRRASRP